MSFIEIDHPRPHVTLVTLNRPERMNAMAFDVMIPLRDALREISLDNECRVVVLTGAGHGFCSGADLVGGGMVPNISGLKRTSIARRAMKVLDDVILAIRDMHQPVIAAVNGAAIGGGFCLAAAADIRIASDDRVLPRRRHQQRAHLDRARDQLPAAAPDRVRPRLRHPAHRTRRRRRGGGAHRPGVAAGRRRAAARALLRASPTASSGSARSASSSPSSCSGRATTPASLHGHMNHEGNAQLYVRMTTSNFDEKIAAWKEGRTPVYTDE